MAADILYVATLEIIIIMVGLQLKFSQIISDSCHLFLLCLTLKEYRTGLVELQEYNVSG